MSIIVHHPPPPPENVEVSGVQPLPKLDNKEEALGATYMLQGDPWTRRPTANIVDTKRVD